MHSFCSSVTEAVKTTLRSEGLLLKEKASVCLSYNGI